LTTRDEEVQRHSSDSRHLHVVDEQHELLRQLEREISIFDAVDRQATSIVRVPILKLWPPSDSTAAATSSPNKRSRPTPTHEKLGDHVVLDVLLLLAEEVVADAVEGVAPKAVVTTNQLKGEERIKTRVAVGWATAQNPTWKMSKTIRPSIEMILLTRLPMIFAWLEASRIRQNEPFTRPRL
jgi:hypothetical protein